MKNLNDTILQDELTFQTRVQESEAYITSINTVFQVEEPIKSLKSNLQQMET